MASLLMSHRFVICYTIVESSFDTCCQLTLTTWRFPRKIGYVYLPEMLFLASKNKLFNPTSYMINTFDFYMS